MAIVRFEELMGDAERGEYAVGYFESWSTESLLAVADAAERMDSPVILGYSGIFLPHRDSVFGDRLSDLEPQARQIAGRLRVPCCLLFNESPRLDWVMEAITLRFGLVMFTDQTLSYEALAERIRAVVAAAHPAQVAVEGEIETLPGVGGELHALPTANPLTDPARAVEFVNRTGIDALAINVGQAHMHGRASLSLDLERISELKRAVPVPLVLHGASSIAPADLSLAIARGVRKVNVGSILKRSYFEALRQACAAIGADYNPYEVIGSGLSDDVLVAGRRAMQASVESHMVLFESVGKAADFRHRASAGRAGSPATSSRPGEENGGDE